MSKNITGSDFEDIGPIPQFDGLGTCYRKGDLLLNGAHGYDFIKEGYLDKLKPVDGDAYVATYPKAGTTWTQEIVYLIKKDLDFESAKASSITMRFPYLELKVSGLKTFEEILTSKPPRLFKTHFPLYVLPKDVLSQSQIVYTARNFKDVLTSLYFFNKGNGLVRYSGNFPEFVDHVLNNRLIYSPYWKHVLEAWDLRHEENLLFLLFEDMKKDLPSVVKKVASFFGKQLSEEQVMAVSEHCSFGSMRKNPSTNYNGLFDFSTDLFMRKGEVGDWKNHFTEEMNDKVNRYLEKYLGDVHDLKFDYEF